MKWRREVVRILVIFGIFFAGYHYGIKESKASTSQGLSSNNMDIISAFFVILMVFTFIRIIAMVYRQLSKRGRRNFKVIISNSNARSKVQKVNGITFGRKGALRKEIRKIVYANPRSLNFLKGIFESTGNINHEFLKSIMEKVKVELIEKKGLYQVKGKKIERHIEDEIIRIIRKY